MVTSEATPFVKTGGLADVLGGLPPALAAAGVNTAVVLPKYRTVEIPQAQRIYHDLPVWVGSTRYVAAIDTTTHNGVPYFFVHCPPLFDREGIYNAAGVDYPDNHIRFGMLCRAALEVVRRIFRADVIHCHDWQAALTPVYLKTVLQGDPTFLGIKTLLTIHNLGYQGRFHAMQLAELGLDPGLYRPAALEFFGDINLLKGGIVYADAINTVSRGYAREIQTPEHGFSLDGLLRDRAADLSGILNGVDYDDWDPAHDKYIAAPYSAAQMNGKRTCKLALLREMDLPESAAARPLVGIVSRFAAQKGFDLVRDAARQLLAKNLSLVALGSGEPEFEQLFLDLAASHPDRVAVRIGYDNGLAHRIEAGADMFLMPSQYEPCGLNQIYSLRYGTVPIVRATGGLDDTIDEGTGFKFQEYSGEALLACITKALASYAKPDQWRELVRRGMARDFSWGVSAAAYADLYRSLLAGSTAQAA